MHVHVLVYHRAGVAISALGRGTVVCQWTNLEPHSFLGVKTLHDFEGPVVVVPASKHEYLPTVANAGVTVATRGLPAPYWYGGIICLANHVHLVPPPSFYTRETKQSKCGASP